MTDDLKQRLRTHGNMGNKWSMMLSHEAADRIGQLETECEELKADAMRYRWLKDNKASCNGFCWHFQTGPIIAADNVLDAAIDAAIAATEPKP